MTPDLEGVERIFRAVAHLVGRPWPADRWLGGRARLAFVLARLDALRPEIERRVTELVALADMHNEVAAEVRELLSLADDWTTIAEELARVVAESDASSPWAEADRRRASDPEVQRGGS